MRDPEIREALVERISREHPDPVANRINLEMPVGLGASRIDVALVNGEITGHEIKSARDNLGRLPSQVEHYGRCLDRAWIVVDASRADSIDGHVPDWWGVMVAARGPAGIGLTVRRRSRKNPVADPFYVAQLLWRDEAYAELEARDLHHGLRRATRWELWDRLAELPMKQLRDSVRARLKARP